MNKELLHKIWPHALAIVFFVVLSLTYFSPQLQGKRLSQHDVNTWKGASQETQEYLKKTGETTLWTNSMFGGMPTYLINIPAEKIFMAKLVSWIHLKLNRPASHLFLYLLGFYIAMLAFKQKPWIAVAGAVAYAFSSYLFIIIAAGHITKAVALGYMPAIIGGFYLAYDRKPWAGAALIGFFLTYQILTNHIQIVYYTFLTLLIFGIFWLVQAIREGQIKRFAISTVAVIAGIILAIGVNSSVLYLTYDYGKDSIRGKSELTHDADNKTSGLDKDYATAWSYGIGETFTLLVPNFKGGASVGELPENSQTFKLYAEAQGKSAAKKAVKQQPTYWGPQSFTSGPVYVGAIICFLFVLGLIIVRGPVKWWLLTATIFSFMLAWGHHFFTGDYIKFSSIIVGIFILIQFYLKKKDSTIANVFVKEVLYVSAGILLIVFGALSSKILSQEFYNYPFSYLFLDYFPGYNKFRTVSMILIIAGFTMPLLGLLAVSKIIQGEVGPKQFNKSVLWAFGVTGGLSLVFALFAGAFSYTGEGDLRYAGQGYEVLLEALRADRQAMLRSDAFRSFFFILLAAVLLWALYSKKISKKVFYPALILLLLIDMWPVNRRYLNADNFTSKKQAEQTFEPSKADLFILKDTDPDFRVLNLTTSTFNDGQTSYFHKSIGGYHGAKMRRYQELIEQNISGEINNIIGTLQSEEQQANLYNVMAQQQVLNMLNTKYIIYNPEAFPIINPSSNGAAWFVGKVNLVQNANEEIASLKRLNTKTEAVVDVRFKDKLNGFNPVADSTAQIKLEVYKPNYLKYTTKANSDQLAVFSEIYYPKGWRVKIDGKEADHFRANYVLRSMVIPAGEHTIEFSFQPASYSVTAGISYVSSIILLLLCLGVLLFPIYKDYKSKAEVK